MGDLRENDFGELTPNQDVYGVSLSRERSALALHSRLVV
jgi:hypothetical protein